MQGVEHNKSYRQENTTSGYKQFYSHDHFLFLLLYHSQQYSEVISGGTPRFLMGWQ